MPCHSNSQSRVKNTAFRLRTVLPPSKHMELARNKSNQDIMISTKSLLKAQLVAGQHGLNKEQFVDVAKRNGWILQIPERLLV